MSVPPIVFKGLLKTLAGQYIDQRQDFAGCAGKDFGTLINPCAQEFFSIAVIAEDLPGDLAAVGVLCDDSASHLKKRGYTFFVYIDSSKKKKNITEDLKNIFSKLVLSHETCHFAFYYGLFLDLGADLSSTLYEKFQNIVSGKLRDAITRETNITFETVVEEHSYSELITNWGDYHDSHFTKNSQTVQGIAPLFYHFFDYLTQE
ncbi:MAG: hypothetical protein FWG66_11780 [Spirochaetes bacterium]|nr:hypothetical protein [Spirochaetota bacterium]